MEHNAPPNKDIACVNMYTKRSHYAMLSENKKEEISAKRRQAYKEKQWPLKLPHLVQFRRVRRNEVGIPHNPCIKKKKYVKNREMHTIKRKIVC